MSAASPGNTVPQGAAVGLGMPVYNGARFIAATLDSILAQTFTDFELVICDNASTDDTEQIARRYAAADARIRYVRHPSNIGAHPNYNRCFELAGGKYFKWTPHDDVLAPDYLASCVQALEENPDAVLCQSQLDFIDAEGGPLGVCRADLYAAQSPQTSERFAAAVLRAHNCYDMQGLFRRDALARTGRLASFHGSDRALVAEMTLLGPFVHVPRPLLKVRDHDSRYTRAFVDPRARAAWHDSRQAGRLHFPTWQLYRTYGRQVGAAKLPAAEALRCRLALARWWAVNWNSARIAVDVLAALMPGAMGVAERMKQSFSPAPGIDRERRRRDGQDLQSNRINR